jgi:PAS domain S-box-containing protein
VAKSRESQLQEAAAELTGPPLPVLLVDAFADNLRELEEALAPLGYPLSSVGSAREALQLLLEQEFGVVLLDLEILDVHEPETAELITQRVRSRETPLLLLTDSREKVAEIVRSHGLAPIDYVLKPVYPELLRSKVASYAALKSRGRTLQQSEALLRGAFEAAPIGKTVLDGGWRIVRVNPAFARMVGGRLDQLQGISIADLCHPDDLPLLARTLDPLMEVAAAGTTTSDLRLKRAAGEEVRVQIAASAIESSEFAEPLLLAQWVDLTARHRAEQARAELLFEQAARSHAEAVAERLEKLQALSAGIEALSLEELLTVLASRLTELFDTQLAEVEVDGDLEVPLVARAQDGGVRIVGSDEEASPQDCVYEQPLTIERARIGAIRVVPAAGRPFGQAERSLLSDAAERIALNVRRAELHEEEHRIALVLQRGLLPRSLPRVPGVGLTVHYEAAGVGAEVGGDWYDAFKLPGGRLGIVVGDVAGSSIRAASAMGQLRTVTRTFAVWDDGRQEPGEVLTRLNSYLLAQGEDELFTVVYAIVDPGAKQLAWAAAGHPPPLLRVPGGAASYLRMGGGLLGIEDRAYETLSEPLVPGSDLVLYTDGLVERRGEALDEGLRRLQSAVGGGPEDPQDLAPHILRQLLPAGMRLSDDVTAVVARIG